MRRAMMLCAAVLCLTMTLAPTALAAGTNEVEICYPTAITQSEDGTELRKLYDLGPEDDPTGIPRSDFEQDGFHYTLTDLLRQELPEHDERQHTETVSLQSANKDMASILALLPQEKEFITEDGYMGTLSLQLDTVQVEVSGYGSSTREISATRSYPNLANQDTSNIPKTIQDNGRTLTLQTINWQTSPPTIPALLAKSIWTVSAMWPSSRAHPSSRWRKCPQRRPSAGLCCWCPSAWWPWWVPWPGRRCSSGTAGNTSRWRRMKCEKKAWEICEEEFS